MAFALGQREGFLTAGNMIPGFIFEPFDLDIPPQDELPALVNLYGTDWNDDWDEFDTGRSPTASAVPASRNSSVLLSSTSSSCFTSLSVTSSALSTE